MWNLDSPEFPSAVMVTYLTPCAMCVPSKNTVIAGTMEGTLLIWDLRWARFINCLHTETKTNKKTKNKNK
jgi:hypothetical protein